MITNPKVYLKQLSIDDSYDCYDLLQHIGKSENEFTNPVSEMSYSEYKDWLIQQNDWSMGDTLPVGYVRQMSFWLMVDDRPVGIGKLRFELTQQSRIEGGNIGYAIDSRYRGLGYGTKLLELLILKAKELQIDEILITIKKNNCASLKVVERNRAEFLYETDTWCYYTIKNK